MLDESGIIKSHDGATARDVTEACRNVPWKLCCTATPAPNDYAELGQHAEFLGVMSAKEMLSMFFVHDGSIRANDDSAGADGWRLKRHAEHDFWRWLASWAVMVRHPADLGFDDPTTIYLSWFCARQSLMLNTSRWWVSYFHLWHRRLGERIGVRRETADERVKAAAAICDSRSR